MKNTFKSIHEKIFLRLILMITIYLFCNNIWGFVVATVGNKIITSEELKSNISVNIHNKRYKKERKQVLKKLIKEKILLIYAENNEISVDDNEVESYFISQLSNHPKLTTNGKFDYLKFDDLKETPEVQKILQTMKYDLLIQKTESIVKQSLEVSDDDLMMDYISKNTTIDLSYAIIDEDQTLVPSTCTIEKAYEYYSINKEKFKPIEKSKFDFLIISPEMIKDSVVVTYEELNNAFQPFSSKIPFDEIRDSLEINLRKLKINKILKEVANDFRLKFQTFNSLSIPVYQTQYLSENEKIGQLQNQEIIKKMIFNLRENEVSIPFATSFGFIIFKRRDTIIEDKNKQDLGKEIWLKYAEYEEEFGTKELRENKFNSQIDKYLVPAALINKYTISRKEIMENLNFSEVEISQYYNQHSEEILATTIIPELSLVSSIVLEQMKKEKAEEIVTRIRSQIGKYFGNDEIMNKISCEKGVNFSTDIVYLKKFINKDKINHLIAYKINQHPENYSDVLNYKDKTILYSVETYFPEYLPDFLDIQSQIQITKDTLSINVNDFDFENYYNENKELYLSSDSLQIAGAFFPIITDSIKIDYAKVEEYYNKYSEHFVNKKSAVIKYVFIKNSENNTEEFRKKLIDSINESTDFSILQQCIGDKFSLPQNTKIEVENLDKSIISTISILKKNEVSKFIQLEEGWIIIKLINNYKEGKLKLNYVYNDIEKLLKSNEAENIAYLKAKTVFDSTRYFSQCSKYADKKELFKTKMLAIDDKFPPIGYLKNLKFQLKQLWKGEKFSEIYHTEDGYFVIFKLQGIPSKRLTFEEALPIIQETILEKNKNKRGKQFVENLIKEFKITSNTDSLLFFFGGLKKKNGLTIDSFLPCIENSNLVIRDALKRNNGDISHPIKISDNQYLFYKVENISKISRKNINELLNQYRKEQEILTFDYWLEQFSSDIKIMQY